MSTRAHVIFKKEGEKTVYVYHHCDGYPEGVGEDLKKFILNEGTASKPKAFAQLLTNWDDEFELDECVHGDEEYIYVIDIDANMVKGYEIWGDNYIDAVEEGKDIENKVVFSFSFSHDGLQDLFHTELKESVLKVLRKFGYSGTNSEVSANILRKLADEISGYITVNQ